MKTPGKSQGKAKYLRMPWRHNANGKSRRGDGGDADYVRLWRLWRLRKSAKSLPLCVCESLCVCVCDSMCACVLGLESN